MKTQVISKSERPRLKAIGRDHAIVIGGSMAGLLAARVLSDYFEHVTVFERDVYPDTIENRRGLPQGHHLHALLGRGQKIVEQFFPGIRDEMIAAGACLLDSGDDLIWRTPKGWGKRFKSGVMVLAFSRPFLDWQVRRRLSEIKNIAIITGADVTELATNAAHDSVGGVFFKFESSNFAPGDAPEFLAADLVVDASGRGSRAPQWLTNLGYETPRETIVNAFLGYASRLYERSDDEQPKAIFLQAAPPEVRRGGIMFPIEGNRWIVTFVGVAGDHPPTEEDALLDFARSLPSSMIFDALRELKSVSTSRSFRATQNRWRHYEEIRRFPGQFVLMGDSVCAFNPVYGQGMTVAAMAALELNRSLLSWRNSRFGSEFTRKFQRKLSKVNALPWALATGEDCRYPGTEGATLTFKSRLIQSYIDQVIALTTKDIKVRSLWLKVFQMLKPPSALFTPIVLLKVARQIITRPRRVSGWPSTAGAHRPVAVTSRDGTA